MADTEEVPTSYEDLAQIEHEFDDVDTEIMRRQYTMSAPLYAKRQEAISRIPGFWPLVFEQAPPDIDQYIQPSDSEIFAKCLTGLDVTRPEIPLGPEKISNETGHPRSLRIRFEFSENEWFTDKVLEKTFWYRRSADGSAGLVSEPVRVHWKKGKDVTQGLMDGAIKLWEARQKAGGNMNKKDLPEFGALAKTVENWSCHNTSFFTWFAFVSAGRWISAEESAEATKKEAERRRKFKEGVKDEEPEDEDDEQAEELVEVCEDGDDLATTIAEDLWPGAIKYFMQAQESAELSDFEFEDDDMDEEEDEDEDEDGPVDIRSLVQGKAAKKDTEGPPAKKQKK